MKSNIKTMLMLNMSMTIIRNLFRKTVGQREPIVTNHGYEHLTHISPYSVSHIDSLSDSTAYTMSTPISNEVLSDHGYASISGSLMYDDVANETSQMGQHNT